MFWLPAPEMLKPGVNGEPVIDLRDAGELPSVRDSRVSVLPTMNFGVLYT